MTGPSSEGPELEPRPERAWPEALADLQVCPVRDLPVPFSSGRDPDGTGRFGTNDPVAKLVCGIRRLCGVCGRRLGGEVVFLAAVAAGEVLTRPVFPDPPMHEACAETAMELCPYIARAKVPSRTGTVGRKDGWLMWVTGSFEMVPGRFSVADFLPGPATRTRRFTYTETGLREI